jgi:hypothetical protein
MTQRRFHATDASSIDVAFLGEDNSGVISAESNGVCCSIFFKREQIVRMAQWVLEQCEEATP